MPMRVILGLPPEVISRPAVRPPVIMTLGVFRHVKNGKENDFLASQRAFTRAMMGVAGFRERRILRDEVLGALVVLSTWESREDFEAAGPALMRYRAEQSRAGKDFSMFLDEPEELHRLEPTNP